MGNVQRKSLKHLHPGELLFKSTLKNYTSCSLERKYEAIVVGFCIVVHIYIDFIHGKILYFLLCYTYHLAAFMWGKQNMVKDRMIQLSES